MRRLPKWDGLSWLMLGFGTGASMLLLFEGMWALPSALILMGPFGLAVIARRLHAKRWLSGVIRVVVVIAALGLSAFAWFGISFHRSLQPVRDVGRYEELLAKYRVPEISGRMEHFPAASPAGATDVKFYHRPGFLQGPDVMQLSMKLPEAEVNHLRTLYAEKASMVLIGGDWETRGGERNNLPVPSFETLALQLAEEISGRFDAFELGGVYAIEDQPEGFYWNHGKSYGVAVEKTGTTVVYWSVSW